jgi:Na+/H+ antiporter NhaC
MVGLIAMKIIPDFGPMKRAEIRAVEQGKVLDDNAEPLMGEELTDIQPYPGIKTSLLWNFFFPVLIVVSFAIGSFIITASAKPMEAFLLSSVIAGIIMRLQGIPLAEIMRTAMSGIKGIMPAIIILALAYSLNDLSKSLNTAQYIISSTQSWLTPGLLPMLTFLITGIVAFSTGTSWGTYAIMIPIAMPLAFNFSGNEIGSIIYATVAAVAGGGVFGDHCSPLSDTSILASTGAASDHIDHIKTQLPYSLLIGIITVVVYLIIGFYISLSS